MRTEIKLDLVSVCRLAGWDAWLPMVSDEVVSVRDTGEVVLVHRGADILLGSVTNAQQAALFAWFKRRRR
jgi:hypothetical protein